jgi:hypothetical protein
MQTSKALDVVVKNARVRRCGCALSAIRGIIAKTLSWSTFCPLLAFIESDSHRFSIDLPETRRDAVDDIKAVMLTESDLVLRPRY